MTDSFKDFFPFVCDNPACKVQYNKPQFVEILNRRGLIYAECEHEIYIGINCDRCNWTSIRKIGKGKHTINLTDFTIMPDPQFYEEIAQQIIEKESRPKKHKNLFFKYFKAWEEENVDYPVIRNLLDYQVNVLLEDIWHIEPSPSGLGLQRRATKAYTFKSRASLDERVCLERESKQIYLRRLYPSTTFGHLVACLSHYRINKIHILEAGLFEDAGNNNNTRFHFYDAGPGKPLARFRIGSQKEKKEKNIHWRALLQQATGKDIRQSVIEYLKMKRVGPIEEERVDEVLDSNLEQLHFDEAEKLRRLTDKIGFERIIWEHLKAVNENVFYRVCTDLALDQSRASLLKWPEKLNEGKGKALLVNAPMGLGKTYSIAQALADNVNLSVVIFMPTRRICAELVERLKTLIILGKGQYRAERLDPHNIEDAKDDKGDYILGVDGFPIIKWKREFLQSEVYFLDGINERECPHYQSIINKVYQEKRTTKKHYCTNCQIANTCRFLTHEQLAKRARIVVTTHAQYDRFYERKALRYWHQKPEKKSQESQEGNSESKDAIKKERDAFIIDEDLVLTNCYQPKAVEYSDLDAFVKVFCDFLSDFDEAEAIEKIETFSRRVRRCGENTIIPPIDKKFSIPEELLDRWRENLTVEYDLGQQYQDVGNGNTDLSDLLIHAIRVGTVVERFDQWNTPYGERFRIYFANPKYYDLSRVPPHVFFDGTMLEKRFLRKKLKKVDFEEMKIKVKPLWKLKVHQNIFTDLPKKSTKKDEPCLKTFVSDLITELQTQGKGHKYFFLTSKYTRQTYLEKFLQKRFPELDMILCHYRNMKGVNDAKDCDIGIVLGSYIMPIAAEVAMALDFIQDRLTQHGMNIRLNETFSWPGVNAKRKFREGYEIVGKLGDALRFSEHRQGIARTRYLFHDVDLYVLSKDLVKDYEECAEMETDRYRTDLFSKKERSDSQYMSFRKDVEKYLSTHDFATITVIRKATGYARATVKKHLYRMVDKKLLRKIKDGREYKYYKMDTIS